MLFTVFFFFFSCIIIISNHRMIVIRININILIISFIFMSLFTINQNLHKSNKSGKKLTILILLKMVCN